MKQILIVCELDDSYNLDVVLTGCQAHSDVQFSSKHMDELGEIILVTFPDHNALERFMLLLESATFNKADGLRFLSYDNYDPVVVTFTMDEFHKKVFHEV